MKKFGLFILVITLSYTKIISQVSPAQGSVVINTLDARYAGDANTEFVILVNRTSSTIDLNGYQIQSFATTGNNSNFTVTWNSQVLILPYSFLLLATTSSINGVAANFVDASPGWADDGYIALRKISPTTSADYIDIVKHWDGAASFTGVPLNSGISISDPNVSVGASGAGLLATRGGVSGNLSSLIYTGYNVASDFSTQSEVSTPIQNSSSAPLPVELTSFSATTIGSTVKLSWNTATEVNNYGFDIERKVGSGQSSVGNYEKIGFINGNGNSNSPKSYAYEDKNVTAGKYSYRLKQIDNDGQFEYSKAIEVDFNSAKKFELSQNYPNPFNPATTIRFNLPEAGNVKLTLYNILGQEIRTLVNEFKESGVHTINFDASELNSGMYIYKIEANGFTQTRKMTLVK